MDMLTAVNRLIRAAGETKVDALDDTHPLQAEAIGIIEELTAREQNRGWWFNEYVTTLQPNADPDNRVPVPPGTVKVITFYPGNGDLILKGGYLYDKAKRTDVLGRSVYARLTEQWAFEDLPETFAEWIASLGQVLMAESYNADQLKLSVLAQNAAQAKAHMTNEHVQNSRVNMLETGSMQGKIGPAWMNRYTPGMIA